MSWVLLRCIVLHSLSGILFSDTKKEAARPKLIRKSHKGTLLGERSPMKGIYYFMIQIAEHSKKNKVIEAKV